MEEVVITALNVKKKDMNSSFISSFFSYYLTGDNNEESISNNRYMCPYLL